jgi:hypothetical protein
MAFKMNRPFKMNGAKKSGLKLGRKMKNAGVDNQISGDEFQSGDTGSGLFYNSKMGPMQMMSPSALKQQEEEEGYMPNEEDSKRVQEGIKETEEKAAENDWEKGSTLEEGDYATYGQTAYDWKGNVIENFQGHEETGPVIMNQHGRPYSEQEGTDELIFWAPVIPGTNRPGSPAEPPVEDEDRPDPEWENGDEVD